MLALVGGFLLSFQLGAEMLNFGAFIAFMRRQPRRVRALLAAQRRAQVAATSCCRSSASLCCAYLWWSLRPIAKLAGGAWLLAGIVYGAIRTRGFTRNTTTFEAPPE